MSTPITSSALAQAQTSSTNHPNSTMATLAQEVLDLPTSASALGRQADSLIEIDDNVVDITGPTQMSAALAPSDNANVPLDRDNLDDASSGWMSDIAERQTAFHVPAVQQKDTHVAVDDEVAFHFRSDRSPLVPRAFVYDSSSRQPSRAPSRSAVSERPDPAFDLINKLVDKMSVDAKAEMERQRADMERR